MNITEYNNLISIGKTITQSRGCWDNAEENLRDYFKLDGNRIIVDACSYNSINHVLQAINYTEFKRRERNMIGKNTLKKICSKYLKQYK